MNSERFDQIVTNRTNERVKARIEAFEKAFVKSIALLGCRIEPSYFNLFPKENLSGKKLQPIFRHLLCYKNAEGQPAVGYPQEMWDTEREAVTNELLGTLDEMARALIAPKDTEPQPIAPTS